MVTDAAGQGVSGPDRPGGSGSGSPPPSRRGARVLAAVLVLVEAVATLVGAGGVAVTAVMDAPDDPATAWVAVVLGVLAGAGLLLVARGLVRRRRWARSPALVTQLLLVPVGVSLVQSGLVAVGVSLLAVALLSAAVLLSPRLGRDLGTGDGHHDENPVR